MLDRRKEEDKRFEPRSEKPIGEERQQNQASVVELGKDLRGGKAILDGEMAVDDVHLKEWEVARDTVRGFDDKLHELRKFGFSFLTVLLTAESILIPGPLAESLKEVALPGIVRLSILLITLLFIVAINLIERNYYLFISAIIQRALVLERALNIELSEIITIRHREGKAQWYRDGVNALFAGIVVILGYAILMPDLLLFLILFFVSLGVIFFTTWMMSRLELEYPHGMIDWSLDRNQCQQGDFVAITITNLSQEISQRFDKGILFEVKSLGGVSARKQPLDDPIVIKPGDSFTCLWDTSSAPPGMYQVFPGNWRDKALGRKITVMERKEEPTAPCPLAQTKTDKKN